MIENYIVLSILVALFLTSTKKDLLNLIITYYASYIIIDYLAFGINSEIIYSTFAFWHKEYISTLAFTFVFFVWTSYLYAKTEAKPAKLYAIYLIFIMLVDGVNAMFMTIDSNYFLTCYNHVQNINIVVDVMFALYGCQNGFRDYINDHLCNGHALLCRIYNKLRQPSD